MIVQRFLFKYIKVEFLLNCISFFNIHQKLKMLLYAILEETNKQTKKHEFLTMEN